MFWVHFFAGFGHFLFLFAFVAPENSSTSNSSTIEEALKLIEQANEIIAKSRYENVIIVLGPSGVGKTPFTKWMTQDNSKLISVRKTKHSPFLMEDNDDAIGTHTIVSATKFPTLYYTNTSMKIAFYDFPGFHDTRGMAYDMGTMYASKGIIDRAKQVKLIFLADYDSVKIEGDRYNFMNLLKSICEFVTNIDKFRNSIAIVISKVPRFIGGGNEEASDEDVISAVTDFIEKEVLNVIKNNTEHRFALSNKVKNQMLNFLSIILQKKNNDYPRISVFRLPNESGPFNNISIVQRGKKRVEKMIYENLRYTTNVNNDFNYTVSHESKVNIIETAQQMKNTVIINIAAIAKNMEQFFLEKEKTIYDIKQLYNQVELKLDELQKAQKNAENSTLKQCIQLVEENTQSFINVSTLNILRLNVIFLDFLQSFNLMSLFDFFNCFDPLKSVIHHLVDTNKWYEFLLNIYNQFSDYNIQKNITSCSNALSNYYRHKNDNTTIIWEKLQQFFQQCPLLYLNYNHLKDLKLDYYKLNAFERIVNYTLQHMTTLSCDSKTPNKLVLKGRFVKLNQVLNANCPQKVEIMEIFASHKVFIDASLNFNKTDGTKLQLSIIAPIWYIENEHDIILDGLPANNHSGNAGNIGKNGKTGLPGLPGNSGGNFLGIGEIFFNSDKLTISANGGNGGNGQNGGDGVNGTDGIEPGIVKYSTGFIRHLEHKDGTIVEELRVNAHVTVINSTHAKIIDEYSGQELTNFYREMQFKSYIKPSGGVPIYSYSETKKPKDIVIIRGKNCTSGGDSGSAGEGGFGGHPGSIFFIPLINNVVTPCLLNNPGKRGQNGTVGQKGYAGKRGKTIVYTVLKSGFLNNIDEYYLLQELYLPSCEDGKSGIVVSENSTIAPTTTSISTFIPTINSFKDFLRESLLNYQLPVNESFIKDFHYLLENNISKYYDTSGFVNELYNLEHQFIMLRSKKQVFFVNRLYDLDALGKKKLLSSFYKSLLVQIDQYNTNTDNEKQLLNYLRIAILSKICIIDSNLDYYFVINIANYFENVQQTILDYKKAVIDVKRNDGEEGFKNTLNNQITQAHTIIMENMLPKINKLLDETNNGIDSLLEEGENLKQDAHKKEYEMENRLKNLKNELLTKKLLGFIQVSSTFLAFAGPAGAAIGAISGGTTAFIQASAFDNSPIPSTVSKQMVKFTEYVQKEQQQLIHDLDVAELKLKEHTNEYPSDTLATIRGKIAERRAELDTDRSKHSVRYTTIQRVNDIRAEMTNLLNSEITLLKQQKLEEGTKSTNKINHLNSAMNIVFAGEVFADVLTKFKAAEARKDAISSELDNFRIYIEKIKQNELAIYKMVIPMVADISKYCTNLSDSSHVDLDVHTWKLQSKLEDIQLQIQEMSDKFTLKDDVKQCISKLEKAIVTMIHIYDRIQEYKDRSQLATYIKAVNSESTEEFGNDFAKLELIIKSNLVMEEYEKSIHVFKQYIFPFAYIYLDNLDYLSNEKLLEGKNISLLVDKAVNQLKNLYQEIKKEKNIINSQYHASLFPNTEFTGKNSFYTWKYDVYKNETIKLLKGDAVVFESDVKQSGKRNAIKFNQIGIRFKCANDTIQSALNTQLMQFKIEMTHFGDSHFRYKDKFYFIMNNKITINHSVNKNNGGSYIDENEVYVKIRQNDPILSPYTLWQFKLEHVNTDGIYEIDNDFSSLLNYTNEVIDLVLEGQGLYVSWNVSMPYSNVDKYYKNLT